MPAVPSEISLCADGFSRFQTQQAKQTPGTPSTPAGALFLVGPRSKLWGTVLPRSHANFRALILGTKSLIDDQEATGEGIVAPWPSKLA